VLAIIGVLLTTIVHDTVEDYVNSQLRDHFVIDSNSSGAYAPFVNNSDPDAGLVISTYYVYNVLNPADVLNGSKPIVEEIGPLNYKYNNVKFNVSWPAQYGGDVVQYQEYQWYEPMDAATVALQATNVTVFNVPLLGALATVGKLGSADLDAALTLLVDLLDDSMLFVNVTAAGVVWGYPDRVLAALSVLGLSPPAFPGIQNNDTSFQMAADTHSYESVYTGKYNTEMAWEYLQWDGMQQMQCCATGPCGDKGSGPASSAVYPWQTPEASYVRGSEGSNFKLGLTSDDTIYIGTYDFGIYRHWGFTTTADSGYSVEGINLLKFTYEAGTYANITQDYEQGFSYQSYGPYGLLNQSMCESGAGIFLSNPRCVPVALSDGTSPVVRW
jgi:hypothetical protein